MRMPSKIVIVSSAVLLAGGAAWLAGQEAKTPVFRTKVDLVVLSFTVTDSKSHYINGLKPSDFRILEDGIVEKISTFAEGNKPAVQVNDDGTVRPLIEAGVEPSKPGIDPRSDAFVGTNVLCSSTLAISCIADLSTPKTRLPTSCADSTAPIRWQCTRSAAIFPARRY